MESTVMPVGLIRENSLLSADTSAKVASRLRSPSSRAVLKTFVEMSRIENKSFNRLNSPTLPCAQVNLIDRTFPHVSDKCKVSKAPFRRYTTTWDRNESTPGGRIAVCIGYWNAAKKLKCRAQQIVITLWKKSLWLTFELHLENHKTP